MDGHGFGGAAVVTVVTGVGDVGAARKVVRDGISIGRPYAAEGTIAASGIQRPSAVATHQGDILACQIAIRIVNVHARQGVAWLVGVESNGDVGKLCIRGYELCNR